MNFVKKYAKSIYISLDSLKKVCAAAICLKTCYNRVRHPQYDFVLTMHSTIKDGKHPHLGQKKIFGKPSLKKFVTFKIGYVYYIFIKLLFWNKIDIPLILVFLDIRFSIIAHRATIIPFKTTYVRPGGHMVYATRGV